MMGDFNMVSGQHEKWGGRPLASSSADSFFQLRMRQGLVDVGSSGPCFTWCNGSSGFH